MGRDAAGAPAWREVPAIELLLSPGVRVLEAPPAPGAFARRGLAIAADGSTWDLNDDAGCRGFLRAFGPALDPLAVALVLVRYRVPDLIGEPSARLATGPADLAPALRDARLPLGLGVEPGRVAFTTAFAAGGRAGADRWVAATGDAASLRGEPLARVEAA